MTWFEFFKLPEDATYEEMKSTYVNMLQENKNGDSENLATIQYYYKEASNYFKNKQEDTTVSEGSTSGISKVVFKEMDVEEALDAEQPIKQKTLLEKILVVLFIVPVFIFFVITESAKWLIKHRRPFLFFLTVCVSFSLFAVNRYFRYYKPETPVKKQEITKLPIEKPLTKEELYQKRLKEAGDVYRIKKGEKVEVDAQTLLLATSCTVSFSEEYYYNKALTGNAEKDAKQKKYNSCYDVYDN